MAAKEPEEAALILLPQDTAPSCPFLATISCLERQSHQNSSFHFLIAHNRGGASTGRGMHPSSPHTGGVRLHLPGNGEKVKDHFQGQRSKRHNWDSNPVPSESNS